MLRYYVAINTYFGMSMVWKYISIGARSWIPSSVSMVRLTISALTMTSSNEENNFYRSCTSTTYPPALLSRITHNITTLKSTSNFIRRTQTPSLKKTVLPAMCVCMPFIYGLLYLTVWINLPMETTMLMKLTLAPPLTLSSLYYTHSKALSITVIQRKSLITPRSDLAAVLDLH